MNWGSEKMKAREGKPEDCQTVNTLMELLIDEIYVKESVKVREVL